MSKIKDKFLKIVSSNDNDNDDALETPEEKNRRWNSIYIVQFTMFMSSLSFSIILTAIWPFLDKVSFYACIYNHCFCFIITVHCYLWDF